MSNNVFIEGRWQDNPPPPDTILIIADPVYDSPEVVDVAAMVHDSGIPGCVFMYPLDVFDLQHKPHQLLHWIKPESTKNTRRKYSNFVEILACYNLTFHEPLHWSNRTGIFTDRLFRNDDHVWKKPESLVERLIRNHYPGKGIIYDPCAGSRTVETVCKKLGIDSFSVDIVKYE